MYTIPLGDLLNGPIDQLQQYPMVNEPVTMCKTHVIDEIKRPTCDTHGTMYCWSATITDLNYVCTLHTHTNVLQDYKVHVHT